MLTNDGTIAVPATAPLMLDTDVLANSFCTVLIDASVAAAPRRRWSSRPRPSATAVTNSPARLRLPPAATPPGGFPLCGWGPRARFSGGGVQNATTNGTAAILEATGVKHHPSHRRTVASFTNTGKLLVTGDSTKLTLDTDVLDNSSGIVQIDAKSAAPGAVAPTLELKTATIDNGTLTNAGLLEATSGVVNTISHVNDDGAGGELFTNTGKLLVTGDSTKLTLDTDVLDNSSGIVQIDAKSAAAARLRRRWSSRPRPSTTAR